MVKVTYWNAPRYENLLADKLGLGADDLRREAKLARLLDDLWSMTRTKLDGEVRWHVREAMETGTLPLPTGWQDWPVLTPRTVWGTTQKHTWLVAEIIVPNAAKSGVFALDVTSNWRVQQGSTDPQCLVWLDNRITQALDGNHTELVLSRNAVPGESHLVHINAFTFDERPMIGFKTDLILRNDRVETLYHQLATAFEVAIRLPQTDVRRHRVLDRIEQALFALDRRDGQSGAFSRSLTAAEEITNSIHAMPDDTAKPRISAFGHTHLDVAWLWRVDHIRQKTARSFATALNLMDEFPDFIFMYNQAVLFNFLKSDYPELWDRVKQKVQTGQMEIDGAMWVEPDVNIISGEALVRQIMRGRQFHLDEFGVTPKSVWLPDTFGYSAALPQIMKCAGIEFFVTSKLSWNDTDKHPYDSFFWRGIDGSDIKSHLITTQAVEATHQKTIYNSHFPVTDILGTWKRYEPKALNTEVMMCYGYGDGGGGPTRDMVQRGLAMQRGIPGAPALRLEGLRPFLDRLGTTMDTRADAFPVWNGELYLQYHRGTLTSVAKNKKNNRIAERRMRELEFSAAMALQLAGTPYPYDLIRDLWDIVLINQFHDILPGTSIAEVYEDSDADYARLFATLDSEQGPMATALQAAARGRSGNMWIVNFTSQGRDDLVELPETMAPQGAALQTAGGLGPVQRITRADGGTATVARAHTVPALGWACAQIASCDTQPNSTLRVSPSHLENDLIALRLDPSGEITSVFDKTRQRELIPPGKRANCMVAFEDKPKAYDAWDIDEYFEDKSWPFSDYPAQVEVVESGPLRAALRITRSYARSKIVQIVSLQEGQKQIEFDTYVDWQERQTLLKTAFPLDLNVSETRAEIQFGHVKRPSHRNTSWDRARFETSMQRWVDMSEPDFGAALLNDCKYGYDAVEQTVRLTLLKGPVMPDPHADLGLHRFRYALLVHGGEADLSSVVRAAERFNNPLRLHTSDQAATEQAGAFLPDFSLVQCDADTITIETVKAAQSGDGLILRLYEHANRRAEATLRFGPKLSSANLTDLMEQDTDAPLPIRDNAVQLSFRPFEIKTLRAIFA